MKIIIKSIAIILCIATFLCLTSCGSVEKITAVENAISAIGTVSLNSSNAISHARQSYEELSNAQKRKVENYDILEAAENKYKSISAVAAKFIGTWDGYKIVSDSDAIIFKDFEYLIKMEYTVEFTSTGKFIMHYYVNGQEGDEYPQSGTFSVNGSKISLSNGGTGEIINGDLVLSFENGSLQHFFSK